jgi:hypothetical protein
MICDPIYFVVRTLIILMTVAVSISETSVTFYQTTWRNIPEDDQGSSIHDPGSNIVPEVHYKVTSRKHLN